MKLFTHLTGKLLAVTITILTLAVIFVTVSNIISFSLSYKQALEERSITVAENIRSIVYKNLKYFPLNGFTGIPSMLQDVLANNPGISYCYIANTGKNILYHSDPTFNYSDPKNMAPAYTFSDQNARGETIPVNKYYESIIPIIYENDYLGTVHVGIEKKIIEQKILSMVVQNAVILLLFLTLAIYLLYQQVTRHITKPIGVLVGQAINIAQHQDTAGTIPITSDDEVGKLGAAFNEMKTSVDSYIRELNFRNKALQVINMIADKLYQSFDIQTIAKEAVESIAHYSNSPRGVLFELDEKNQLLRLLYSRGFSASTLKVGSILPLEGSLSGIAVKRKQVITTFDVADDETIVPEVRAALLGDGLTNGVLIPLLFQDKVYGVLNLLFTAQERGDFQEYERETLFSLGKTIGLAMANARHVDQIKEEVTERQRAEESLRESEIKYRNIFNNSTEGIFQTTPQGLILTANPSLAQILAYDSPEDAIKNIKNLATDLYVHPERREEFLGLMNKQGFVRDFEYQAYRKDRTIIDVTINTHVVWDENHKPLYFEGTLRDVTELKKYRDHLEELVRERTAELTKTNDKLQEEIAERRRAEEALRESENKYRTIFNNSTEGIFQTSPAGRILTANPSLAQILAYDSADDLIASIKNLGNDLFVHTERRKEFLDLMSKQGFVRDFEYQAYRKDRQIIDVAINVDTVRDENHNFRCFEGTLRDITQLKKYQEHLEMLVRERTAELTQTNETLHQEVAERKRVEEEIRKLNEELEQRVIERTKELESFSYSVSHDLRAPLRSVDGFSRILMEDFASELSADAMRYLQLVRTNAQQMAKLIADLLQFSRMGRQAISVQDIRPKVIVQQALDDLQSMQEGRQVNIVINELPACHADPALLKVVYVNMLSNALKYTGKKEKAEIEIGCYEKDGTNTYYVKDNGAGFDMKYVDKMFGVFQRLHRADEFEGTGCGTAIIQRIIHRHGGRIWVEAELNKGATFFFTLGVPN